MRRVRGKEEGSTCVKDSPISSWQKVVINVK